MKAIKIASGVAVTALAAAISAQAGAAAHGSDTEATFSYTGSMEFLTAIDFEDGPVNRDGDDATVIDVELDEEDDFDSASAGEAWGLEMGVDVVHGPFSGSLQVRTDDGTVEVDAGDIVITDGAISFGQVGELIDTAAYAYDMDGSEENWDAADLGDDGADEGRPVDAGLRYTMNGLKVQVEGENRTQSDGYETDNSTSDVGVGAQYSGEADALSYVAEVQYRTSTFGGDDDTPYTYIGAGATYTTDMFTVKGAVNNFKITTAGDDGSNGTAITEYGFEVEASPIEAMTVYVKGQDLDAANEIEDDNSDSLEFLFGATYTMNMITVTGEYTYTVVEEDGDTVYGEVEYEDGPISAYGSVEVTDLDGDAQSPMFEAGVAYTQDNGVKYAADMDFQSDSDYNDDVALLKLTAAYAF